VDTRNLINIAGKNSADMRIADDIRSIIERKPTDPQAIDIIVICSSDRDFRPLLRTAKRRGQKMVLLALEECTGDLLKNEAKSDIRYFKLSTRFRQHKNSYSTGTSEEELWPKDHPLSELIMQIATWFHTNDEPWASPNRIASELALGKRAKASLDRLIEDGAFERRNDGRRLIIRLNSEHKIVQLVSVLSQWLLEYFEERRTTLDSPPTKTNTVIQATKQDRRCKQVGLGKNPKQIEAWLDLAASAGILAKQLQESSKRSGKYVNTWWLPGMYHDSQRMQ
jgi:hypothetical protein